MSGHSKWNNIKKKKEKTDGQRAKIFTKIGREIAVAVKEGGPDPAGNSKLADVIQKAKDNNVPNENIDRIIKKAAGDGEKNDYEEIMYEGYGPNGVAVIVEALTDNRNRTAGDLRHFFDKCGGNLGQNGCVSFMFNKKGVLVAENDGTDEEKVMDDCFESGADDYRIDEDVIEIFCGANDVRDVKASLVEKGYKFISAEPAYIANTEAMIDDEESVIKMQRLLELLDDDDDVQNVWHNWGNEPEEEEDD